MAGWTSRRGEELWTIRVSRRGGETSRRGEVLWPVRLHEEVKSWTSRRGEVL